MSTWLGFCFTIGSPLTLLFALLGVISWTADKPVFTASAVPVTTALPPSAATSTVWPVAAKVLPNIFWKKGPKKLLISCVPFAK